MNVLSMYGSPGESVRNGTRPNAEAHTKSADKPKAKTTKAETTETKVDSSTNPVASNEGGGDLDDFINGLDL